MHYLAGQPSHTGHPAAYDRSSSIPAEHGYLTAGEALQVMDTTVFRIFEAQAGRSVAAKFFDDYLGLLPVRSAKIVAGIAADDTERSLDAAVSLKVVSAMVGARRMEECAGALERQLRRGHAPAPIAAKLLLSRNILQILAESQRQGLLKSR